MGFGGILVIFRFRRYFGHFLGFGGILVIFWVLVVFWSIFNTSRNCVSRSNIEIIKFVQETS